MLTAKTFKPFAVYSAADNADIHALESFKIFIIIAWIIHTNV